MILTVTLNASLDEWVDIPSLRIGGLNRATDFRRYVGGKGVNVSRVVHELGERTMALSFAGGQDGAIFRDGLRRLGVPHDLVTSAGTTRNNYKIHTRRPEALTEINTAGPRIAAPRLRELALRLRRRARSAQAVVLSGSVPPGAPASIYRRWIPWLKGAATRVVLDASGEALRHGLRARPWLIKPNRQEAAECVGRALSSRRRVVQAVCELLRRGPELVVLSMGREGALLGSAQTGAVWSAVPPSVRVTSAVGAGDALVAGFVVGWLRTRSLVEALRLGVACGAATALTPGTELCHRRDVRRLLGRVRVTRLVER